MAVVSHQGVAGPFEFGGQAYTAFGFRAPALRGFRLTFTGSRDREIGLIGVLPGGVAQDASPGADPNFPPAAIPDGTLQLYLQDSDPSVGETFGWEVSHSVMTIPGARRYQIRDVGCAGACSRVLPANVTGGGLGAVGPPPLIALVGFRLFFAAPRARELDRIGVWFTGNELNLALQDESVGLTDTFGYLVDFIVIPRGSSLDMTACCRDSEPMGTCSHERYSRDLRERIASSVEGAMPKAQAARTFRVSLSSVKPYVDKAKRGKSLAPKKRSGAASRSSTRRP